MPSIQAPKAARASAILLAFATPLIFTAQVAACTAFVLREEGRVLYGRNYDWYVERGMLMVNKRGLEKSALAIENPAKWTSRFGSVTFNQYGREFPNGGMNEAGGNSI